VQEKDKSDCFQPHVGGQPSIQSLCQTTQQQQTGARITSLACASVHEYTLNARNDPGLTEAFERGCATGYFTPMTIESGPIRCSARVVLNPASVIQPMQSSAV
jgi:hypothetical protein